MKIFTQLLCAAALLAVSQQAAAQTLLDNFETTRLLSYPEAQGVLTQEAANPFKGTGNNSTSVAKFVRDANSPYSTITIRPKNGKFADVSAYKSGAQKLTMKFLSPGPDLRVNLVMQDKDKVAYPAGNYAGLFFAVTTAAANTWETLTFTFEAPEGSFDPTVTAKDIDQIAMLIAPGVTGAPAGATYYFDDFMGPATEAIPTSGQPPILLDDFETSRYVEYPVAQGVLTEKAPNPFKTAANNSASVAKFERSASDMYSTIAIRTKSGFFADVSDYASGAQKMTMKFLSPGPGTRVQLVLQNAATVAYPKGNYAGDFFATTTAAANTWETLTFDFTPGVANATFDPTVKATDIDQIALLIAPGSSNNGATYYFDDLMGPALVTMPTANRGAQNATAAFAAVYPNPAAGITQLPYSLQKSAVVSLAVFDNLGRRVAQVIDRQQQPAGQFSAELNAARLAPGLYTCRLTVDGVALTRRLSVQ
ncbi:T9SS type A sorting domain-containing protein [Hymenobacter guriensis]|uniref:T9SS type A sorting domain-containing protein n=1 Tax=Hymenobacter guriensis TaxID=2793065 RepID=A0ABS0L6H6_9BACT|nr:T9SS type A sorting domain-containing protein [Hymenobacter guriensis]MBG8555681.1 T9SS type A sorting domain-containing protein [Hymenobacter guriensis]